MSFYENTRYPVSDNGCFLNDCKGQAGLAEVCLLFSYGRFTNAAIRQI